MQDMHEYETVYILKPDLPMTRFEKVNEKIQKIISESKGELAEIKDWGKRKMAYAIAHHTYGQYVYVNYYGSGHFITDIERTLKYEEDVMRFMTLKVGSAEEAKRRDPATRVIVLEEAKVGAFDLPLDDRDD